MKFQKQVMPCGHLRPDIMSSSWEWMAYPAYLPPCRLCSFSARLSKWIWFQLVHYFVMTSILFPQPQTVKGFIHKLWAILGSNEHSHTNHKRSGMWFPVTKAPLPLALVLVERVPWVPVLPYGLLLIYLIAVSIRDKTSSNWSPVLFRCPSILFSNLQ